MLRTHVCSSIFTQMHEQHLRCSSSFIEGFFYFVSTFPSYSVKPHALVCNQVVQCWFIISVSAYYFLVWHHSHFESLLHSPSVTWYFNNKQEYFKIMLKLWFFTGGNTVLPGHIMQCPEMSLSRAEGWVEARGGLNILYCPGLTTTGSSPDQNVSPYAETPQEKDTCVSIFIAVPDCFPVLWHFRFQSAKLESTSLLPVWKFQIQSMWQHFKGFPRLIGMIEIWGCFLKLLLSLIKN